MARYECPDCGTHGDDLTVNYSRDRDGNMILECTGCMTDFVVYDLDDD